MTGMTTTETILAILGAAFMAFLLWLDMFSPWANLN